MPLVALNWDANRILVAIARKTGNRVQFDQAMHVDLIDARANQADQEPGPTKDSSKRIGEKLRAILYNKGVQRGDATVIVARSDVEMRQFDLPPVPDEEVADLVKFQARNQFTSFHEDGLLDYVPILTSSESINVLAASISPAKVNEIRSAVEATGLKLRHIVLRPFAAVELVRSNQADAGCRLIVEPLGRQADLSVVSNDYVLFTRTVRVPETYSDDQFDAWLPGEIRRTMAAARNQSNAPAATSVVVCGKAGSHPRLVQGIADDLGMQVSFYDPFDAVPLQTGFERPTKDDGFASLFGSLVLQHSPENHALDFLNPRQNDEPSIDKRKALIVGGIAAALLLAGSIYVWSILHSKEARIAELTSEIAALQKNTNHIDALISQVNKMDEFKKGDIEWLEEFAALTQIMPLPDDARVDSLLATVGPKNATITLKGRIADEDVHTSLSQRLPNRYEVETQTAYDTTEKQFKRRFHELLRFPLFDVTNFPMPDDEGQDETEQDAVPVVASESPSAAVPSATPTAANKSAGELTPKSDPEDPQTENIAKPTKRELPK